MRATTPKPENRAGFTLIELLIVVVIIGILAAIAIPKFTAAREKAFLAAAKSDLRNLANLQEIYHNSNYTYSSDLDAVGLAVSDAVYIDVPEATGTGWSATATHAGLPSTVCAMYHGNATQVSPATVESVIQCN